VRLFDREYEFGVGQRSESSQKRSVACASGTGQGQPAPKCSVDGTDDDRDVILHQRDVPCDSWPATPPHT